MHRACLDLIRKRKKTGACTPQYRDVWLLYLRRNNFSCVSFVGTLIFAPGRGWTWESFTHAAWTLGNHGFPVLCYMIYIATIPSDEMVAEEMDVGGLEV